MTTTADMKTTRLAQWFGADTAIAERAARELGAAKWVGIGCVGGGSIIPLIECRGGVANDRHRHIINLFRVVADTELKALLIQNLDATIFHPDELAAAQLRCIQREQMFESGGGLFAGKRAEVGPPNVAWARDYFISVWMGRGGSAGTKGEFNGSLPTRWNANGGGSNTRYRSAADSINAWNVVLKGWEFETLDVFEFVGMVKESEKEKAGDRALYLDPPWVGAGDGYKHRFTESHHRKLAKQLSAYQKVRVVVRYGDDPLIREIYPASRWNIIELTSRDQGNKDVAELLILNGPSHEVPHD